MYFRQPAYFGDFKCVGGICRFTCCSDWNIDWTEEEIEKLKNAPNISDEMLALIETSFRPNSKKNSFWKIELKDDHSCPFLTEEKLCRIQKELGEEYLSHTCTIFPRNNRIALDIKTESYPFVYRYCNLSCPEISKRLVTDKKAMNLVNIPVLKKTFVEKPYMDSENTCEEHPEVLFRTDMFEFFYGLISDKRFSVETAILHGAIAADILTNIVKEKNYGAIPQALEEMRAGFLKGNMLSELDKIQPDYNVKVGFVGRIIATYVSASTLSLLKTPEGKLDLARYLEGEKNLKQMFNGEDYWLRNIALNMLFELSMPIHSPKYTILENYALFVMAFACFKCNAITSVSAKEPGVKLEIGDNFSALFHGTDRVWGFASIVSRSLCQNENKAEHLIEEAKSANLTTPGQLALLIK